MELEYVMDLVSKFKENDIKTKLGTFRICEPYDGEIILRRAYCITQTNENSLKYILINDPTLFHNVFKYKTNFIFFEGSNRHYNILLCFTDGDYIMFNYRYKNTELGIEKEGYALSDIYSEGKLKAHEILTCLLENHISPQTISK